MITMALFEWRDFEEGLWIVPFSSPLLPSSLLALLLSPSSSFLPFLLLSPVFSFSSSFSFLFAFFFSLPPPRPFFLYFLHVHAHSFSATKLNYFSTFFKKSPERVKKQKRKNSLSQISTSTILLLWHLLTKRSQYHWKERYHYYNCCYCYSITLDW